MMLNNFYQRKAPFLHRNWLQGITNWQGPAEVMGNIVSSQPRSDGQAAPPPRKRRRISTPDSLNIDRPIVSSETFDRPSTLRIEVRKICHKDSLRFRTTSLDGTASSAITTTQAVCRITVTNTTGGARDILYCHKQACDLITSENSTGPHPITRVNMANPFLLPRDVFLVPGDDDARDDLADTYELLIQFEQRNGSIWPPLTTKDLGSLSALQDTNPISSRKIVLKSRFHKIFGKLKESLVLSALGSTERSENLTEYIMDVDLRWSSGLNTSTFPSKDLMPSITAIDRSTTVRDERLSPVATIDPTTICNRAGRDLLHGPLVSDDEQCEGAATPSRALRRREQNKNYNLKVLSDQARGKEPKRRLDTEITAVESPVTYLLPLDQPVLLDCNRCIACGAYHETRMQLQMHLQMYHADYDFQYENTSQGPQFRVQHRRDDTFASPSRNFQVQPTVRPFNLKTYVVGDMSWATKRLLAGDHDELLRTPIARPSINRMPSRSPIPRQPILATSKTTLPRQPHQPKKSTVAVPKISQPLYHPISKTELTAGDPVPSSEHDSTWLIQKHRESIAEFSDVTPQEKEYIWEWDDYILRQNITANAFLPRAWLGFVQRKAVWLVAKDERMREYGKHLCVLLARDLLTDEVIRQAQGCIREARSLRKMDVDSAIVSEGVDQAAATSKAAGVRKSGKGCPICQLPVLGPRLLVCANKSCPKRLYHSNCVEPIALVDVQDRNWICNVCAASTPYSAFSPPPYTTNIRAGPC